MITMTVCDAGDHAECPGEGLVQGTLRPPHQPQDPGRQVWVSVPCNCPCHGGVYHGTCDETPYLTLVIRARSTSEAREIAQTAAAQYLDHVPRVDVEWIDPAGPSGVIVEDAS